jgi:DNA polymerase-1
MVVSNCYGMGEGMLAKRLGLPTYLEKSKDGVSRLKSGPEGLAVLRKFHRQVPYVGGMAKKAKDRAERRGYIVTILGRRCHFPRRPDGSYDWTNNGLNRLIQGSAGDQIKLALVAMGDAGLDSQVQVHDEVVGGYPNMEAARAVQSIMEGALKLRVPSRVDLAVGPSWGEAQKVK